MTPLGIAPFCRLFQGHCLTPDIWPHPLFLESSNRCFRRYLLIGGLQVLASVDAAVLFLSSLSVSLTTLSFLPSIYSVNPSFLPGLVCQGICAPGGLGKTFSASHSTFLFVAFNPYEISRFLKVVSSPIYPPRLCWRWLTPSPPLRRYSSGRRSSDIRSSLFGFHCAL